MSDIMGLHPSAIASKFAELNLRLEQALAQLDSLQKRLCAIEQSPRMPVSPPLTTLTQTPDSASALDSQGTAPPLTPRAPALGEMVIVKTPPGACDEDVNGIHPGLFLVAGSEWRALCDAALAEKPGDAVIERDLSCGAVGCILVDDLAGLIDSSEIVRHEGEVTAELADFIRDAGNDEFLEKLREWAATPREKKAFVVLDPESLDPLSVYESWADMPSEARMRARAVPFIKKAD